MWRTTGSALDKDQPYAVAAQGLAKIRRELLVELRRRNEAIEEAWADFCSYPDNYRYEESMRYVPKTERAAWHAKVMEIVEGADLSSAIPLLLETKETGRLVRRRN